MSHNCGVGSHQRQGKRQEGRKREKSEEKERDRSTRVKRPIPRRAIDALIEEGEQNGKQKIAKRKKQGATLDHSVTPYYAQGSYSEPILITPNPPAHRRKWSYC